ncbi:hypothetical protein ETAA8_39740 [Anatilimnocola aggregata]|uniref:Uncharacterized protein n=1 Tax=Anatilimnocola aggregata TaxID=2528021 RepID=A0A517YE83_9BACT|nr:hypothetical protein ETAA8_36380 [Anatilimnocola aggregata]QDU28868.1 hypothetical protein ETAA8_39740 [Anatilimnocola aggregata]
MHPAGTVGHLKLQSTSDELSDDVAQSHPRAQRMRTAVNRMLKKFEKGCDRFGHRSGLGIGKYRSHNYL